MTALKKISPAGGSNTEYFFNRTEYFSIHVQVIYNAHYKIIDIIIAMQPVEPLMILISTSLNFRMI